MLSVSRLLHRIDDFSFGKVDGKTYLAVVGDHGLALLDEDASEVI